MLSPLKDLQETLAEFIRQDRCPAMVVRLSDVELVYLLKMIQSMDEQDKAHVFALFPQPVSGDAGAYATAVLDALRAQLGQVAEARVAAGEPPWPAFPAACADPGVAPSHRLRAGIAYAASLIPGGDEHRLVFCLAPQAIANPGAYAQAIAALLPSPERKPEPGCGRVRLLLRDDAAAPRIVEGLRRLRNPDVLIYEPDLSPAALMDATARDIADPALSEAQRMQMLMELASLDFAFGRLEEAVAKYGILFDYYRKTAAPIMQGLVLQGTGDVLRRIGRLPLARERYAQGLTLVLQTQALPLMMTLAYSVGDVSLELHAYADAESHLEIARQIAAGLKNRPVEADALEKLGMARMGLKRSGEAVQTWRAAADVARTAQYRPRLISVLERLAETYAGAHMRDQQRACERELGAVRAGGQPS